MNICCDNEDNNEAQLLGFFADPAEWRAIVSCSLNFRSSFSVWDASFAKVKIQEVGRGSDEHKFIGESLNYDWVPLKFVLNLIKLLGITSSLQKIQEKEK